MNFANYSRNASWACSNPPLHDLLAILAGAGLAPRLDCVAYGICARIEMMSKAQYHLVASVLIGAGYRFSHSYERTVYVPCAE